MKLSIRPVLLFLVVILGVLFWIIFSKKESSTTEQEFYRKKFNAIVVSSNYYYHRSIEFHLSNGFNLYFMPSDNKKLMVGDSIQKNNNTFLYTVYRKNIEGEYEQFGTYDYQNMP